MSNPVPSGVPVYFVVYENTWGQHPARQMYGIKRIVRVIAGDIGDINDIHARYVEPLYQQGCNASMLIFDREMPNPFRELTHDPDTEVGPVELNAAEVDYRDASNW